jgi:3-isopropylmalate/(R)-2-methylmalate dehydratase small subunit
MHKIESITGNAIPLLLDDIDTDRIIPARYLRCVTFEGLGEHAFKDDRQQHPTTHPFDDWRFAGGSILVAGRNFGCGSSREHAPQALIRFGLKACIAESFAEIFFGNCTSLGVACVSLPREALEKLATAIESDHRMPVTIDLVGGVVRFGQTSVPFQMPEGARKALVTGEYDFLAQLLENEDAIRETASRLPYVSSFAGTPN